MYASFLSSLLLLTAVNHDKKLSLNLGSSVIPGLPDLVLVPCREPGRWPKAPTGQHIDPPKATLNPKRSAAPVENMSLCMPPSKLLQAWGGRKRLAKRGRSSRREAAETTEMACPGSSLLGLGFVVYKALGD